MALVLPQAEDSPTYPAQAELDKADLNALANLGQQTGVVAGCGVTPHVSAYSVDVAAGTIIYQGTEQAVTAVSALAPAAVSTSDRRDAVVVSSTGTVSIIAGSPCGLTSGQWSVGCGFNPPVKPSIPSTSILLAEIYVPGSYASTTVVSSSMLTDKSAVFVLPYGSALFEAYARANSLDQFASAAAAVSMGGFPITGLQAGVNPTDAANISQLPGLVTLANTTATTTTTSTTTLSTLTGAGTIAVATLPTNLNALNYCQVPTGGGGTAILSFTGASAGNLTGVTFISATSGTAVAAGAVTFGFVPDVTGTYLVRCIGGGGQGGGGGVPSTTSAVQNGGGGGASGAAADKLLSLTAGTFYPCAAGASGSGGGAGGASSGASGGTGNWGGNSSFGSGPSVTGIGGGGGSFGIGATGAASNASAAQSESTTSASGGTQGGLIYIFTSTLSPGVGGFAFNALGTVQAGLGGCPAGGAPGGGGCGGQSSTTKGGGGGGAGTYNAGGGGGGTGTSTTTSGLNGSNGASTDYGAGGGGGGGASSSAGTGGNGGNGTQGAAYILGPLV